MSLQNSHITSESRLTGQFCSATVYNLNDRVLTDAEIKKLEKGLDFAPLQRKINEPELKQNFKDFCRSMRLKWYFWDERQQFSETPASSAKSSRNPPRGHPCLELFLVRLNTNSFEITKQDLVIPIYVWKNEELKTLSLTYDKCIINKKADKGSCVMVWDRNDYDYILHTTIKRQKMLVNFTSQNP